MIFPSTNDVGGRGLGIKAAAESLVRSARAAWSTAFGERNFVISGLAASDGGGLTASITAGVAFISGYIYEDDSSDSVTLNASESDQQWYLQLVRTAGRVSGSQWVRVVSPNPDGSDDPADSCRVFNVDTGSTSITGGPRDTRGLRRGPRYGSYAGNASTTQSITLGFRPLIVLIYGDNGVRAQIFSISTILQLGNTRLGAWADDAAGGATSARIRRAELTETGFTVESDGTNDSLNENGRTYYYIAFPL